jgi:hypothetical protein
VGGTIHFGPRCVGRRFTAGFAVDRGAGGSFGRATGLRGCRGCRAFTRAMSSGSAASANEMTNIGRLDWHWETGAHRICSDTRKITGLSEEP